MAVPCNGLTPPLPVHCIQPSPLSFLEQSHLKTKKIENLKIKLEGGG